MYLKPKHPGPILWSSIEGILSDALQVILNHLQEKYKSDSEALVYFTVNQSSLVTALRSSVHVLKENTIHAMISNVMSTFNRFVNSNQNVVLNDTFEVFFKVVSGIHVNYRYHRRRSVPLRTTVGSWSNQKCFKKGGLVEMPDLATIDKFFDKQCLLLCLFYQYYRLVKPEIFKNVQGITKISTSKQKIKKSLSFLKEQIEIFCMTCNLTVQGPRDLVSTLKLFCEMYLCQVIVIKSMDGIVPDYIMIPESFELNLPRIYCLLRNDHIVCISNLNAFFAYHKKKICFGCKKFYYYWLNAVPHRCPKMACCKLCGHILQLSTYRIQQDEKLKYCDSSISSPEFKTRCDNCNNTFGTTICYNNHIIKCNKKQMPYHCDKCNTFVTIFGSKSYNDVKNSHICGDKLIRCRTCFKLLPVRHKCEILKAVASKNWPSLAVMSMAFKSSPNTDKCDECFKIKLNFAQSNHLSIKDVLNHAKFETLLCNFHKEIPINSSNSVNAISVWIETERFVFDKKLFVDSIFNVTHQPEPETLFIQYASPESPLNQTPLRDKNVKVISKCLEDYLKQTFYSAEKLFFNYLMTECSNVTFVAENDATLLKVLDICLSCKVRPKLIQKGRKIFALELTQTKVKFINFSNYVPGDLTDWITQFQLKTVAPYFPNKLNNDTNIKNLDFITIQFSDFVQFGDPESVLLKKKEFFDSVPHQIISKHFLIEILSTKTTILLTLVTNFLKQTFKLQSKLALAKLNPNINAIHPFSDSNYSTASFVFHICQFYFLNNLNIYSVPSPFNGNSCFVSSGEFEYMSFLDWKFPHLKLQHAFNNEDGQKVFGKINVDGYSEPYKCVYQFHGCYTHCHNATECLKPSIEKNPAYCERKRKTDENINTLLLSRFPNEIKSIQTMWSCFWEKYKKDNFEEIENFWRLSKAKKHRPLIRLVPRAAIRGGLLDTYCLKALPDQDNIISFVDCQSLYSHVASYCELPLGSFVTLTDCDLKSCITLNHHDGQFYYKNESMICDIALVEILAPSHLFKPFLSYRVKDEFVFLSNCYTCANFKLTKPCRHKPNKRSFTSTWTVTELAYAVKVLNYEILNWYEVHHYNQTSPVLADFVKILASEKLKSSNVLAKCSSMSEKQTYCDFLNKKMAFDCDNLKLTPANCSDNPPAKTYFKMCLNSLYGRFALHSQNLKHVFCTSMHDLQVQTANENHEILDMFSVSDDVLELVISNRATVETNRYSNMYYTALINAQARIYMYKLMKSLADSNCQIIAVDTDSICFKHKKNFEFPFQMSDCFGDFKFVLGPSSKIDAVYSLGVRDYIIAYTDHTGSQKFVTKIKGMALNSYCNLTPDRYLQFIEKRFQNEIDKIFIPQMKQQINKQTKTFNNLITAVEYSNELHVKRFILSNDSSYKTYPFGYDFKNLSKN